MKVVLAGGSGNVGSVLRRHFAGRGDEVIVLSRSGRGGATVWDGETLGPWVSALEGADVVINLAGRTVNCRYNAHNLREMMDSRVRSTKVLGQALGQVGSQAVWLQSSTATIYAHRFDAANDEETGILGGQEPHAPPKWVASIEIAKAWEAELEAANVPGVRKVAMRSAMTMSADPGSVFHVLATLARRGLGGRLGNGKQFVSWIHEADFAASIDFLIDRKDLDGPINLCSPYPLPQAEFAQQLRKAVGAPFGLPAAAWMIEIGTWAMRTESELVLKSRRVVPKRLLDAGFEFRYPHWTDAAADLASRM